VEKDIWSSYGRLLVYELGKLNINKYLIINSWGLDIRLKELNGSIMKRSNSSSNG